MADTHSQTITLGVLVTGKDAIDTTKERTLTIKVPNPRDDLQPSDFTNEIKVFFANAGIYTGKLQNDPDTAVSGAYREVKTSVSLDLTPTT